MMEEFWTASNLLRAALERYLAACSTLANCYDPRNLLEGISREILDLIPGELESTLLYKAKLKQATALLNQTRNIIPTITPINTIPPDILAYIFELIMEAEPRYSEEKQGLKPFPLRYPDILSHVCSRWRQIATSSRILWTRIDIPFQNKTLSRALLARAELFASRADPSSLDLHIGGQPGGTSPDFEILLNEFCASVASRVKSLNLSTDYLPGLYFSILKSFFPNCTPGTLNELVINGSCNHDFLIGSSEIPTKSLDCAIDMSYRELEDRLAPITVLRLTGAHFDWGNMNAYSGLVELSLHFLNDRPRIPLVLLLIILQRNPGLRVLHLDIEITVMAPFNGKPHVGLDDLEVLNLRRMDSAQCKALLQFLCPGTKPLQLSLQYMFSSSSRLNDELAKFLARSNVTELHIEWQTTSERYRYIDILELLNSLHLPHLRALSLAEFLLRSSTPTQPQPQNHGLSGGHEPESFPTFSQLDSLRLTRCKITLADLQMLIETLRISTLRLTGCFVLSEWSGYDSDGEPDGYDVDVRKVLEIAPMVKLMSVPNYLWKWDPWG